MLNAIGKAIAGYILGITIYIFLKNILEKNSRCITIKDFASINVLTWIILIVHDVEYNVINPIVIFLTIVFGLFAIYKVNLTKSILCSASFLMVLFLADLIGSIIFAGISNIEMVRKEYVYVVIANFIVSCVTILIIKTKKIKGKLIEIINELQKKNNIETITFIFLMISTLSLILYLMSKNYFYNKAFFINAIGIFIFIVLSFIFFKEKYEKEIIIHNYDQLFEYVKTFEEWIDTENMNIHESKNQLATLRDMIKNNKKAVEYIDNIMKERINIESNNTIKLKNIPKGGLKGLLFYKITLAENQGIELFIDISENVQKFLKKLNVEEIKNLCRLVGIFFDNAIEASSETKKKKISCEIYLSGKDLNIVISNTYKGIIDLEKVNEKNYSTKGKNRGKGLYLANKFSNKSNKFKLENRIINNYYVQKIIIKKEH